MALAVGMLRKSDLRAPAKLHYYEAYKGDLEARHQPSIHMPIPHVYSSFLFAFTAHMSGCQARIKAVDSALKAITT